MFPFICKYAKTTGNTRKNNALCCELPTTLPTKELKAFFAFAESLATSATLGVIQARTSFLVMCGSPK